MNFPLEIRCKGRTYANPVVSGTGEPIYSREEKGEVTHAILIVPALAAEAEQKRRVRR